MYAQLTSGGDHPAPDPYVEIREPQQMPDGTVLPPEVVLWPYGLGQRGLLLAMPVGEAETLCERMARACAEAREMFGAG